MREVRQALAEYGFDPKVAGLVVATYAELGRRSWFRGQDAIEPPTSVDEIRDDMVLRRARLPEEADWAAAVERAAVLFGTTQDARIRSPRSVARLAKTVSTKSASWRQPAADLVSTLDANLPTLGVSTSPRPDRARTADVAVRLLDALRTPTTPTEIVEALARVDLADVAPRTLLTSLSSATDVAEALRAMDRQIFGFLRDSSHERATGIRETLAQGIAADELVSFLRRTLEDTRRATLEIMVAPTPPPTPVPPPPPTGKTFRGGRAEVLRLLDEELPEGSELEVTFRVVRP